MARSRFSLVAYEAWQQPLSGFCEAVRNAQSSRVERHLGNLDAVGRRPYADPPPAVGSIEPRSVLPSHTNWSRSAAPSGIWAIIQSRIAEQMAATSTCRKK